jgi:ubiquitin-activating enzyme E1
MALIHTDNHNLVDESLYSRQLYAIGLDAMKSIVSSKVLISNLTPLAVEICKNIILCGCGTLTLADSDNIISEKDLGLNYYITEKDFGKKRSDVMGKRMQELNKNVIVNKYSGLVDEKICSKYDLIVFVDPRFDEATLKLNEYCRSKSIKTIYTSTNGIYGFIFCDFNNFITTDINGEKIRSGIIVDVSEDVLTMDKSHDLESNVEIKIENTTYNVIKVIDRFKIKIDTSISKSCIGSMYTEIKSKLEIKFKSLRESILEPEFVITDFAKMDKPQLLHDINIKIRQNIQTTVSDETDLYKKIIKSYDGCIVPLNSVTGGIVAHNITAGICNKYQPIKQWLYYDIEELYNDDNINDDKFYSNQVKVIGKELQSKLNDTKLFIVGSGAIGCEHLKNFVMMGIKNIIITDLDQIEKSNLNRQFLFRNTDIGKYKSQVAAEKAMKMNPKVKIESRLNKVGIETENIFDKKFYSNINLIVNALDNIHARNYMDQQAINYNLPLLESGTLGLKGNVQVVIPNLTESYQSSTDQAEESIPVCTLKNFPYEIAHCIQFAREQFESEFIQPFQTYNLLKKLEESKLKEKLEKSMPNELFDIHSNLNLIKDSSFEMFCQFYNQHYRQKIHDLIIQFPENHLTNDGEKFWSGTKKFPKVIDFVKDNETCVKLFESYQQIMKEIGYQEYQEYQSKQIESNINSELKENNIKIAVTTEEDKKNKESDINMLDNNKIKQDIINFITTTNYKFKEIEFEKDDDSNGHIKFITACSNLRAMNYSINPVSEFETKGIAGKIIPALATTTAVVSGLVSIELLKLIKANNKPLIENFKNTFLSLGISFIGSSEPISCPSTNVGKLKVNLWTQIKLQNMTLQNLLIYFETEYNVNITNIMYQDKIVYSTFINKNKIDEILNKKISDILEIKDNFNISANIEDVDNDEISEIININIIV